MSLYQKLARKPQQFLTLTGMELSGLASGPLSSSPFTLYHTTGLVKMRDLSLKFLTFG